MLFRQRDWLFKNATTEARAINILQTIIKNLS